MDSYDGASTIHQTLLGGYRVTHFMTNGIGGYDLHALRPEEQWQGSSETEYSTDMPLKRSTESVRLYKRPP